MSGENIDEFKSNEDQFPGQDEMGESLVPDLDSITQKKKLSLSDVNVQVCNPITREEKFTKHTVYTVKGTDKEGNFEVVRRYSDFDRIRALLVTRWPGCYIPPLPPKNKGPTGNMESKFIEERRRLLNSFCKKIGELPYLHYSEEYQIFIRSGGADLEKTFAPMAKISYEDLISKYSNTFSQLSGKELNNETVMKIAGFKVFLQKTQGYFENFMKIARSVAQARRTFYEQFALFHNNVALEYEKHVFSEYHNNAAGKNVFSDPNNIALNDRADKIKAAVHEPSLEYLYEWLKIESREIEAFIEAINQRDKYENLKNKTHDKQKSDTLELQKVLQGKTTMKTLFSRKPKEEEVSALEKSIDAAGKEMEQLTMIHDMITLILAYNEIEKFKNNKLDQYYQVVKLAAQSELGNVRNMIDYWNVVIKHESVAPHSEL